MRYRFYFGLLLIFFLVNANLFAQNFWVPDANFRNKLKQLYPTCFTAQDSLITNSSQIQNETILDVSYLSISSLEGIQFFLSLTIFGCSNNQLSSLPSLPGSLTHLFCANNQLTSLPSLPATLIKLVCDNNQLTSLPALPLSLYYLDCSNNQLTSLTALPATLELLYCQNNQFVSLPALPATLSQLFCNNNQLTSLPSLPPLLLNLRCFNNYLGNIPSLPASLGSLWCTNNLLTSLPSLPGSLTNLSCEMNQLSSLPSLPGSIIGLSCGNNQLTSLPSLPVSLTKLDCRRNQLTSLPSLPASLNLLWCPFNQLTSLPSLPASLNLLECNYNQLTSLPNLPPSLTTLVCGNNQLTSLPSLPATLTGLNCSNNQLTILPILPASLTDLYCKNNRLTTLPTLPAYINYLYCDSNQLSSLPVLPGVLLRLYCSYNQLSSLPRIPGYVHILECTNNPISCFPDIAPRIPVGYLWVIIKIDSTLISCIPNQGTFPLSVVQSSQPLPTCNPNNTSCNYNYTFGNVFLDINGNGSKESLEQGLELPVYYSGNSGVFPDSAGIFFATSDTGNISFQVAIPPYYTATNANTQTINVVSGIVDTLYFGLQPIPNIKDLKVDLTSISFLRPGFKAKYKLHYQNVGTDTLYNVQLKFLKPYQLSNLTSQPTANSVNGDTLIWNIASLIPYHQGDVVISDSVFTNAVLGDTARAYAWIEPLVGDTTPLNNSAISTNIIRGAYDPNDKSVSINRVLPNSTDNLEYTIRFQNTGTDTAFTVTLIDKLSDKLDISSMHMISASHNYELSIVNGFAKWVFKNILLPDSNSNELESHGFVKFGIKPKPGLTVTDSIQNKADIYFDYNAAVTTNTIVVNVLNTLQVQELKETEFQVFPNPVQESIRIVTQHAGALGKIELINASGKVLDTKTISTSTYTWNLRHLPAGTYILKWQGWGQKVVKE